MIQVRVMGIPAQAEVTSYLPGEPEYRMGHPDTWEPAGGEELEYQLFDRKGYRAEWLERKIAGTDEEIELINYLTYIMRED